MSNVMRALKYLWVLFFLTACSMNASIDPLNPVATVTLQKKIYFDVNDPTNVSMVEGSFAVVNIALDAKSETDTVIDVVLNGPSGRFEAVDSKIVIPAGSLSRPIVLQTINDSIYQGPQDFLLIASKSGDAQESEQARLKIKLQDDEQKPSLSIANSSSNENSGSLNFTVSINKVSALDTEFYYAISDGTAVAGADYTAVSSTKAVIPAGQTSVNLSVAIINDNLFEADETFTVTISSPLNADIQTASAAGTILNDDLMPSVAFTTTSSTQAESAGTVSVQLSLSALSNVDVSVPYTLSGTATSGADFNISLPSPIVIPAGTLTKNFNISIIDDSISEFSETAIISLGTPTNASLGSNTAYTLTITDNDMATVNFATTSQTINESYGVWSDWPSAVSTWTKRRSIEINGLSSSINNFTVLIKLDSSRINYSSCQSLGQDLRFYDSSGTLLSHEIESWDAVGTSYVWVKVPSIPASPARARIWMYYGNSSAADGQDRVNVWESNYKGVWHLNGNAQDSTINVKDGTPTGVSYIAGLAGQALSINGILGNNIKLPDSMSVTNILTVSLSFKTSSSGVLFGHTNTAYSVNPATWDPLLYVDTAGKLRGGDYAGGLPNYVSSKSVNDNQWHQAVWVGNTTSQSLYLDGALVGTYSATLSMSSMIYNYIGMGYWDNWPSSGTLWKTINATIDEVSISSNARDLNWVQYNYASMNDLIISISAEESATTGLVNVQVQLDANAVNTVSIPYTLSGTATNGSDYISSVGTLTIPVGNNSGTIPVRILKDSTIEPAETIILTLGSPANAVLGSQTQHTINLTDEVNSNPVAVSDNFTVTTTQTSLLNVLTNDSDANGDVLTVSSTSASSNATISIIGKNIYYTPNSTFSGTDTFTYTVLDGRGGSSVGTVNITFQVPFTWTGASNSMWTNPANWVGGVVPGASNIAYFNNQCSVNCNPVQEGNISLSGIRFDSSYTGTLNQVSGKTISIGSSGWFQSSGVFNGLDANITIAGNFTLNGGSFKTSSALNTFTANFTDVGVASLDASAGTVRFQGGYSTSVTLTIPNRSFNAVAFYGSANSYTLSGTMNVGSGGLTLRNSDYGCGIYSGTINLTGNLTIDSTTNSEYVGCDGTALIKIVGSTNQTIAGNSYFGRTPKMEIASTGGTVFITSGVSIWNGFKHTSGVIDSSASAVKLNNGYSSTNNFDFNSTPFATLYMTSSGSSVSNITGTAYVSGDLHLFNRAYDTSYIFGGQFDVSGNLYADGTAVGYGLGMQGTSLIRLVGTGAQSINGVATAGIYGTFPKVTINSSGVITFLNNIRFRNDFTHTASAGVVTTGSTVSFVPASGVTNTHNISGINFNNLELAGASNSILNFQNASATVNGNLVINDSYGCYANNITVSVYGNVSSTGSNGGCMGNSTINFVGGANSTFTSSSSNANYFFPTGNVTINKPGATLTLLGRFNPNSAGQSVNLTAGTINLNGQLMYTKGLSLNGNTINLSAGTLYVNGVSISDGTPYGGTIAP